MASLVSQDSKSNCVPHSAATIGEAGKKFHPPLSRLGYRDPCACHDWDNVIIVPNVTIGGRTGLHGVPVIGNHVAIGAGGCILGPVTVGDHAAIGANAVVLIDVPAYGTAVGIPARVVRINRNRGDGEAGQDAL